MGTGRRLSTDDFGGSHSQAAGRSSSDGDPPLLLLLPALPALPALAELLPLSMDGKICRGGCVAVWVCGCGCGHTEQRAT